MTKTKTAGKILKAMSMSSRTCFGRPLGLPDWPFWNGLPLGLRLGLAVLSLIAANCLDIGPSDVFHGESDNDLEGGRACATVRYRLTSLPMFVHC